MHIHAFFKSAPKVPAKGQAMPKGPLLDISYPFGRHLVLLQTSLHSIQNVRDGMLTDQEPGTRSCAIPVHQLSLFSCARGLTPTTQTLAGKSAADGSVWYPEMTRSPITVRLHCRVRSSEKPQG